MRHRTALITAGSIAALVFAGAIAVGVNLGILTVADSSPAGVGKLTAGTMVSTGQAAEGSPAPSTIVKAADRPSQLYVIKKAGRVKVAFSKSSVRLVDVGARPHWTWELAQAQDDKLSVTFSHGSDAYTFTAALDAHGKLTAKVDHPVTRTTPAASSGSTAWVVAPAAARSTGPSGGEGDGGGSHGGGEDD
jgi:hypothetical protein